jgi:hypothetical protein
LLVITGREEEAIPILRNGLAIRRRRREVAGLAITAAYLAAAYLRCGQGAEVEALLNEALAVFRRLDDWRGMALCHALFGQYERARGNELAAETQWGQAYALLPSRPDWAVEQPLLAILLPEVK